MLCFCLPSQDVSLVDISPLCTDTTEIEAPSSVTSSIVIVTSLGVPLICTLFVLFVLFVRLSSFLCATCTEVP